MSAAALLTSGMLKKKGHRRKNWTTRFFMFRDDGALFYFKKKQDPVSVNWASAKGSIPLSDAEVDISNPAPHGFTIHTAAANGGVVYEIRAGDAATHTMWVRAVETAIRISTGSQVGVAASEAMTPYVPLRFVPGECRAVFVADDFAEARDGANVWAKLLELEC
eukprot:c32506_g1_i1.p2 GENE.c32506_g1_i1~~c32506_g1_i1.p2  ORF type:complete len:164 (-),score=32.41 c32506_g1_i1:382-873(-)